MKKELKVSTLFYPLPVLLIGTFDKDGNPDRRNAAWGGVYEEDKVILSLSSDHKTTENIKEKGVFSLSFAPLGREKEADYVGRVSAKAVKDKVKKAGFGSRKDVDGCPLFDKLPLTLVCKADHFDDNGNLVGKIRKVFADEEILDKDGKVDVTLLKPLAFDPSLNQYYVRDKVVGGKAFSLGKEIK